MPPKYLSLIEQFLNKQLSAAQFSEQFMRMYKQDTEPQQEPFARYLDMLFAASDSYCENPEWRDAYDLDEAQLWERVAEVYAKID